MADEVVMLRQFKVLVAKNSGGAPETVVLWEDSSDARPT